MSAAPLYRYQWVWQWGAIRHFPQANMTDELKNTIEDKIRQELLKHPEITSVESITHSDVKFWTSNLGLTGNWSGTTTTVFLSTEPSESPIAPVIAAIIILVLGIVLLAIIAFIVWNVTSTVNVLAEKAPFALNVGALALLGLVLLGAYVVVKRPEVPRRAVEYARPVAAKAKRLLLG